MEKKTIKTALIIGVAALVSSCATIPNAPGAYKPAPDTKPKVAEKPVVEAPVEKEVEKPVVMPEPVVEPKVEPAPVVEPEPVVEPAPVVEEVTRAEVFEVVDAPDANPLKHYNVVIGSFGVKANADRLKASMMNAYTPVIVKNERNMYRVILSTFDDYQAAHRFIDGIKGQFADAWVLVEK